MSLCNNLNIEDKKNILINNPLLIKMNIFQNDYWFNLIVSHNGQNIKYIKDPSEKIQMLAISKDVNNIKYIKNPTKNVQRAVVKSNSELIKYIENPTVECQFICILINLEHIKYINNLNYEIAQIALSKNGLLLKYIDADEKLKMIAVEQNGESIKYINNPSMELQRKAIEKDINNLKHIYNLNYIIQKELVLLDLYIVDKIINPYPEIIELSKHLQDIEFNNIINSFYKKAD